MTLANRKAPPPTNLILIQFEFDAHSARERDPVVRRHASKMTPALDAHHAIDHVLRVRRSADVVQPEDLLQSIFSFLD